jgi:hypothetical protein
MDKGSSIKKLANHSADCGLRNLKLITAARIAPAYAKALAGKHGAKRIAISLR